MRLQQLGHARRGRHGQIMVIFALVAVGLVGTAALGINVFYIYWNKNQLQGGTDAAALAGATYFNNVTFTGKNGACLYATDAQNAACTYALERWSIGERAHQRGGEFEQSVDDCECVAQGTRALSQGSGDPKLYR
jgi:Putative Flp pilus-assembly TadE/G-like